MAFQTVIAQQSLTAGVHRSGTRTLNNPAARISIRLISSWLESDDMALFGVERFDTESGKWRHIVSAVIYGGARGRDGSLPTLSFFNVSAGDYRLVCLLAQTTSLGLELEVV